MRKKYNTEEERKEATRESNRRYRERNKDKINQAHRKWYANNSEHARNLQREYKRKNPQKIKEYQDQYHATKENKIKQNIRQKTRHWNEKTGICNDCKNSFDYTEFHHISYEPSIFIELCKICHGLRHRNEKITEGEQDPTENKIQEQIKESVKEPKGCGKKITYMNCPNWVCGEDELLCDKCKKEPKGDSQ